MQYQKPNVAFVGSASALIQGSTDGSPDGSGSSKQIVEFCTSLEQN
jgi:hypothetical protein